MLAITNRDSIGGINITLAMLLFILALGGALYSANSNVLKTRLDETVYRHHQAAISAQSAIAYATAHLAHHPTFIGTMSQPKEHFDVETSPLLNPDGSHYYWPENPKLTFFTLRAMGYSRDRTTISDWHARQVNNVALYRRPLVSLPAAPIITNNNITLRGRSVVGAHPNGGGNGIPRSIISGKNVMLSARSATCAIEYLNVLTSNSCLTNHYSTDNAMVDDIQVSNQTLHNDLLKQTFGYPHTEHLKLRDIAGSKLTNCKSLNSSSYGLYWVSGDCVISSSVATLNTPIILVIENGDLTLNNAHLNGMVYLYHPQLSHQVSITMSGTSAINGVLLIDSPINTIATAITIKYDKQVYQQLIDTTQPGFSSHHYVLGSAHDID